MSFVYTAPWIIPIRAETIQDGAIAVNNGTIIDLGPARDVVTKYSDYRKIELSGILMPPLVNGHIHLELSHLKDIAKPPLNAPMTEWIAELLDRRGDEPDNAGQIQEEIDLMLQRQYSCGVGLVANIGNNIEYFPRRFPQYPEVYSIYEVTGPTNTRTASVLKDVEEVADNQPISPHALYSSSAELITALKRRARNNDQILSIHVAESPDEQTLVCKREGAFRQFLERRNSWDNALIPDQSYNSAIEYLDKLGVLDERTLCVHCVHIRDKDIEILKRRGVQVCLCPESNAFLGVGEAPIKKILNSGILPALGTDSCASNTSVNLWSEMKLIREIAPDVEPLQILTMATYGGATALHRQADFGSLGPGRKGVFLEIDSGNIDGFSEKEMVDHLTSHGKPDNINWIFPVEKS